MNHKGEWLCHGPQEKLSINILIKDREPTADEIKTTPIKNEGIPKTTDIFINFEKLSFLVRVFKNRNNPKNIQERTNPKSWNL